MALPTERGTTWKFKRLMVPRKSVDREEADCKRSCRYVTMCVVFVSVLTVPLWSVGGGVKVVCQD